VSTVREETENERARVCNRAREFGKTVRELEDKGEYERRKRVRTEWRRFSNHLSPKYRVGAIDAYYDEYCREPTEDEYETEE
jgi:hypothetical protein